MAEDLHTRLEHEIRDYAGLYERYGPGDPERGDWSLLYARMRAWPSTHPAFMGLFTWALRREGADHAATPRSQSSRVGTPAGLRAVLAQYLAHRRAPQVRAVTAVVAAETDARQGGATRVVSREEGRWPPRRAR